MSTLGQCFCGPCPAVLFGDVDTIMPSRAIEPLQSHSVVVRSPPRNTGVFVAHAVAHALCTLIGLP